MSDLSEPLLHLLPTEAAGFAWPTPDLAGYPAPTVPAVPPVCAVEGVNGNALKGRLSLFDPSSDTLHLLMGQQRRPMQLKLDQFRRLCLTEPLQALAPGDDDGALVCERPSLPFTVHFKDGRDWQGETVGHQHRPWGLFLFEQIDSLGSLRRWFVPRAAYSSAGRCS